MLQLFHLEFYDDSAGTFFEISIYMNASQVENLKT